MLKWFVVAVAREDLRVSTQVPSPVAEHPKLTPLLSSCFS